MSESCGLDCSSLTPPLVIAQERRETSLAGTTASGFDSTSAARGRCSYARRIASKAVALRHVCRFRPQPEYCRQQVARYLGRFGVESTLYRNPGPPRLSLYRAAET